MILLSNSWSRLKDFKANLLQGRFHFFIDAKLINILFKDMLPNYDIMLLKCYIFHLHFLIKPVI
jgi:hypothetical protein